MGRVLITGSAGFVGSHVVRYFLEKTDWKIVGLDSFRHRGDSLRIPSEYSDRYQIYTCDVGAPFSDRMIEKIGEIDSILNIASDSHVDRSIQDPVPFIRNNIDVSLSMLELARKIKPKIFIQVSTDEVYGPAPEGVCHKEWSPILPSNPYSASKSGQEAIAISYWRSYGVPILIVNTMNMFGEMQDKEKFIPSCISKIFNREKIQIHGNSVYIGKRYYLHARNFADALLFLIHRGSPASYQSSTFDFIHSPEQLPDRYNVVGEIELNNLQVAQAISEMMAIPFEYELVDFHYARPGHDRRYALDGSKMKSIGWVQKMNFHDSLKETIDWTLKNKIWLH